MDHCQKSETEGTYLPLEFFRQLPKTDLHVHLDGSLRINSILDLAKQYHVDLPATNAEELYKSMNLGRSYGSLEEYLKVFGITLSVMQHEDALFRVAYELAEDAANENVQYMEVRYSPMLHTQKGLKTVQVVEAVLAGLQAAKRSKQIETNVIICGIRNISPESSIKMAELAVAYKERGVVGFDLAGAEHGYPAKQHQQAFQLARDNNINCTIHAGEVCSPESIAQAIHICGAHRIGHGYRLCENDGLLNYVNEHRIPLECCPSSSIQTGAVRNLATHPLKSYFNLGLRVTINTDNRLISNTTMSNELWNVHTKMGMKLEDIKLLIIAGFKSSFTPLHVKQAYLRRVTSELTRFTEDGKIQPALPTDQC